MTKVFIYSILFFSFILSCKTKSSDTTDSKVSDVLISENDHDEIRVYESENLIITQLSPHVFLHLSYLNTEDFGKVGCNGMIVVNENEAIVFDTPADIQSTIEMVNFLKNGLKSNIEAIIPTHFHKDCIGGLEVFDSLAVPTYASKLTVELIKEREEDFDIAINEFVDSLTLKLGDKDVQAKYYGAGHTADNVIGFFPSGNAVFGGCLIKRVGAGKGNLEDADLSAWAQTVSLIKSDYPDSKIVIPGHGQWGGTELFDFTINLFK